MKALAETFTKLYFLSLYVCMYINIQQLASNQDVSFFSANGNIFLISQEKSRKLKCATAGTQTADILLSGQAP